MTTSPLLYFMTGRIRSPVMSKIGDEGDTINAVESVLSSQSSGMTHGSALRCVVVLKPRSYMCGGFDVGGELSIQFPRHEGIKCYAVVSG
jgi:hypothetical protein